MMWAFDVLPAKDNTGKDILPDPESLTQGFVCMPEPFPAMIRPRSQKRADLVRRAWAEAHDHLDQNTGQWKNVPAGMWKERQ